MSRRRLERGFWNGRQVGVSAKEYKRIYVQRWDRGGRLYHRFALNIRMDWPFPDEFTVDGRLPRKTKKALWKQFNGHPDQEPRTGVLQYTTWPGTDYGHWARLSGRTPELFHNGRKP